MFGLWKRLWKAADDADAVEHFSYRTVSVMYNPV